MKLLLPLIALLIVSCPSYSFSQESSSRRVFHTLDGLPLSLESYPIINETVISPDGKEYPLSYRKPMGEGPFPVMLFFHGGVDSFPVEQLETFLKSAAPTRFLNKGYMVVASTRRSISHESLKKEVPLPETENPKSYSGGMVFDGIAAVQKSKTLSGADPESIVIYGGSVGGSLAIETAAQTTIAAVIAAEPTSGLWMGLAWAPNPTRHDVFPSVYTDERRSFAQSVLSKIDCPFLLLGRDPARFDNADHSYIMRELVLLGKTAKSIDYAGYKHGFFWGNGRRKVTEQEMDEVVEDAHTFILPHLRTKPDPL